MIKFFRNIRKRLLSEDKISGYIVYATGEIFLVVIGILIALGINNWNEDRKREAKTNYYISSLVEDLKENLAYIKRRNEEIKMETKVSDKIVERINNKSASIDTIEKIGRSEIGQMFYSFSPLIDNTFRTLQSTGHMEYLEPWLQEELQKLNFSHNDLLGVSQGMREDYALVLIDFLKVFPRNKHGRNISEELSELVMKESTASRKISALNNLIWIRRGAYYSMLRRSQNIEVELNRLIDTLVSEYQLTTNLNM
jgi:hypothetical protein